MRMGRTFACFASWIGLVVWCSAAALPGCDSKNNGDDDDDDSGGESGASGSDGPTCDASHACASGFVCAGGTCVENSGTGGAGTGGAGSIPAGQLGGACKSGETCNSGLFCNAGICVPDTVGAGGSGATQGTLAGPCYPNDTCNAGLTCLSGYCVAEIGSGGSGGGSGFGNGGASTGGGSQGGAGGTGGSDVGGSGGSTGGTGGPGGAGTGGGGSGGTPSTQIVAADGWVADGSNTVGVVGPWYVFVDQYSTIEALPSGPDFTGAGAEICVSGIIRQSDEYGPTVALNLNQPDPEGEPLGYVPDDHSVAGFSYALSGSALPSVLQITYAGLDGSQYCIFTNLTAANVNIAQTGLDCWDSTGVTGSTSLSYATLQFQLPVNYHADGQVFDFCISSLTALTN